MAQATTTDIPPIGEVIRAWRKFRHLRSTDLADKAGVRVGYLSEIEHNRTANPRPEYLEKLAVALEIPLIDIHARQMPPDTNIAERDPSLTKPLIHGVTFGSGVGIGAIPRLKTEQELIENTSQESGYDISLLIAQIITDAQLAPEIRILAERLILQHARSVCEVLSKEHGPQRT